MPRSQRILHNPSVRNIPYIFDSEVINTLKHAHDDRDKNYEGRKQFWSKYFAEKLSFNGIDLRHTTGVRLLEDNRYFWRRVMSEADTGQN